MFKTGISINTTKYKLIYNMIGPSYLDILIHSPSKDNSSPIIIYIINIPTPILLHKYKHTGTCTIYIAYVNLPIIYHTFILKRENIGSLIPMKLGIKITINPLIILNLN